MSFGTLTLLVAIGLLGPLLSSWRRLAIPVVVGELAAGVLVGPTVFALIHPQEATAHFFYLLGFAMLMLTTGMHLHLSIPAIRQRGVVLLGLLGTVGLVATGLGFGIDAVFHFGHPALLAVLIAGSSAALGFPMLDERGLLAKVPVTLAAWIVLADTITVVIMPFTLSGKGAIGGAILGDFGMVATGLVALFVGGLLRGFWEKKNIEQTSIRYHWGLQLRATLLLLLVLATISSVSGGSILIAGLVAGVVIAKLSLPERLSIQLVGVADGFFVPLFFVLLGATIDLRPLFSNPKWVILALALLGANLTAKFVAALVSHKPMVVARGLLASAQLGLPAAAVAIGLDTHLLSNGAAAAFLLAGVLTMIPTTMGVGLLVKEFRKTKATQ